MNERIQELAKQAGLKIEYQMINPPKPLQILGSAEQFEKFAELIIRECARAVDKVYEDAEPDHGCYDWATWAEGADVLKHFGVE
jgi:hypothetical protein